MEFYSKDPTSQIKAGPFTEADIRERIKNGQIAADFHIHWGSGSWTLASDFLRLGDFSGRTASSALPTHPSESLIKRDDAPRMLGQQVYIKTPPEELALLQQLVATSKKQLYWMRIIGVVIAVTWITANIYTEVRK